METTKLTLEHLSVYLPYGLKCKTKDGILQLTQICTKGRFKYWFDRLDSNIYFNDKMMGLVSKSFLGSQIKPILKPLSYFEDMQEHPELDWYDIVSLRRLSRGNVKLNNIPYHMIAIMAKEHIDMFNLIPAGLAINYFETI